MYWFFYSETIFAFIQVSWSTLFMNWTFSSLFSKFEFCILSLSQNFNQNHDFVSWYTKGKFCKEKQFLYSLKEIGYFLLYLLSWSTLFMNWTFSSLFSKFEFCILSLSQNFNQNHDFVSWYTKGKFCKEKQFLYSLKEIGYFFASPIVIWN